MTAGPFWGLPNQESEEDFFFEKNEKGPVVSWALLLNQEVNHIDKL